MLPMRDSFSFKGTHRFRMKVWKDDSHYWKPKGSRGNYTSVRQTMDEEEKNMTQIGVMKTMSDVFTHQDRFLVFHHVSVAVSYHL